MAYFKGAFGNKLPISKYWCMSYCMSNISYTDTTLSYLVSLNLESFKNGPVDSFLSILPSGYLRQKIVGGGRPRYAEALMVIYPNGIVVHVVVRHFTHMNPRSKTLQWDINLFRQEDIDHIEIHQSNSCIKGCQ